MHFTIIKHLFITFLLVSIGFIGFAQNTAGTTALNDSLKKKTSSPKVRVIGGYIMSSINDVMQNIKPAKEFSVFTKAIDTAGLDETFETTGPITVFAPVNKAFEKLSPKKLDSLLAPKDKVYLTNLLTYHVIAGKVSSKDIEKRIKAGNGQATFTTLAGGKLTASINNDRNIVLTDENGGQSIVSSFDVPQSNGLLHVITGVLFPKSKL